MTQATSPQITQPPSPLEPLLNMQLSEDRLSSYALNPFNTNSTPSSVALAPHALLETAHASNYFSDSMSSSGNPTTSTLPSSPAHFHQTAPEEQSPPNKPLVYFRMDPTMEMYNIYPMATVAPWLVAPTPLYQSNMIHQDESMQNSVGNMNNNGDLEDNHNTPTNNHYSTNYQYRSQ